MKRLKNLHDCRRYLADAIRRLEAGELSETKARTAGYLVNVLRGVIENSDLEERLQKLEAVVNEKSK